MQEVSELSEEKRKDWIQEEYFSGCKFPKFMNMDFYWRIEKI